MESIINFIKKHIVTSVLAFLTLIGTFVVAAFSGSVFMFFLVVLCAVCPLLIWVIDAVRGDAENERVKALNDQIAKKNKEIEQRNLSLENEVGIKRDADGEVIDSNLRWKILDEPPKEDKK